ncbi:MAG TPA: hypothetical protein PKW15_05335 [Alphaproteobacteria bacterium]|nr:hypothetical protein [Rhodospirillaceae bacterium]HRJ12649.1 hypothetical protein [Alphaproteobacteria bacterium]
MPAQNLQKFKLGFSMAWWFFASASATGLATAKNENYSGMPPAVWAALWGINAVHFAYRGVMACQKYAALKGQGNHPQPH